MDIVENLNWVKSASGRKISLFQSDPMPVNPILIIGGVHGDEPEGVWLAEATLDWLKANRLKNNSDKKTTIPWLLIPCLNPDGIANNTRTNANGVDLNRNYPSRNWSPTAPQPRYNPGPSPGSEPEINAIIQLIKQFQPRAVIHCHSWEPCIVYTGEPGRPLAETLSRSCGYEMRTNIGYPTPGSLSQYSWHDRQIPVICIEEKENSPKADVWPHFSKGMVEILTKNYG